MNSASGAAVPSLLIRQVRRVCVGTPLGPDEPPVDVRIIDGQVSEVGLGLVISPGDEVVDGAGRWLIPGLWDQHVHLGQWALTSQRLDVSSAADADAVVRLVAHELAQRPDDDSVLIGFGHRSATWPSPPSVAALDRVSGRHPVVLISGDAHNGWLNSVGLALLGLSPRASAVEELDWFPAFERLAQLPAQQAASLTAYRTALAQAASRGVVGVGDMEFEVGFREWPPRVAEGLDTLRVRAAVYPDGLDAALASGLSSGQPLPGTGGLVEMGPLKIISDGSLNTRTAFCESPFLDTPCSAGRLSSDRGKQNYEPAELVELMRRAHAGGLRLAVHAIGDAAVGTALDAFELTRAAGSIEHAQLMSWPDMSRMARLGVIASVQPAHLLDDRDVAERCWGERTERVFAFAALRAAGVRLAFGSDAPVSPLDPWLTMAAAVHRSADERPPWHPEQAIGAAAALQASTDGQTSVSRGSRGDLVLLDDNPWQAQPGESSAVVAHRLRNTRVAATIVAGRVVFSTLG